MGANSNSMTKCGNLFLFGATDTLGSTHYLQEPSMRTDEF